MDLNHLVQELVTNMACAETMPVQPWKRQKLPKSNEKAKQCRLEGNKGFKMALYGFVLKAYNAGLCYAPPGSEEIPLIYGNRSAVYFELKEYALAIENIELARQNGYPVDKMAKLDHREEKCKALLEAQAHDNEFDASSFFKLSYPPNPKIPFIADCLEIRKCEKHGRGIFTTKDLKTGDIIAIEDPVFSWPGEAVKSPFCAFCSKTNKGSLIPCSCCTSVMYCSEECREKAAVHDHKVFTLASDRDSFAEYLKLQREAFQIAGGVTELLELLKGNEEKTIFDYDFSNPDDPDYQKNLLIALNGLIAHRKSSYAPVKAEIDANADLIVKFPPINEQPRTAEESEALLKFVANQWLLISLKMSRFPADSDGLFVFKSLMNHSCLPDVFPYKFNEKLVLIVTHPVKAGSQVFDCTTLDAVIHSAPKRERTQKLSNHDLKCDCQACVNDWPVEFPRKDSRSVEPDFLALIQEQITPAEAIEQFKENCKYIDENFHKMPCYEVQMLSKYNSSLINLLNPSRPTVLAQ